MRLERLRIKLDPGQSVALSMVPPLVSLVSLLRQPHSELLTEDAAAPLPAVITPEEHVQQVHTIELDRGRICHKACMLYHEMLPWVLMKGTGNLLATYVATRPAVPLSTFNILKQSTGWHFLWVNK